MIASFMACEDNGLFYENITQKKQQNPAWNTIEHSMVIMGTVMVSTGMWS